MANENELYIYTTPPAAHVELALDQGQTIIGSGPTAANGRADAHLLILPADIPTQGGVLRVSADGFAPFENRGIVDYTDVDPIFILDDVHLALAPVAPTPPDPGPTPPPSTSNDPEAIIHGVYDAGGHNLATHDGCGKFTEACCDALRASAVPNAQTWGHILKTPGQNQYSGHAVDALMCLAGPDNGIWDIVHDSVSPNASPQYIYKGPPDPALWYYDMPGTEVRLTARARGPYAAPR